MTAGERVIAAASRYIGVHESAPNRGDPIDAWEARWELRGVAWCGLFADAMFAEAGVDDGGLCHYSVAEICRRARAAGAVWDGRSPIPPASLWASCGVHVALLDVPLGGGLYSTVEGNHNNAVGTGVRDVRDALVVIPPAVRADWRPAPAPRRYWLEDERARPRLYGPWATEKQREHELATIVPPRRRGARRVHGAHGGYAWIEGPRRVYGPWSTREAREQAQGPLERRLGHPLRVYSREG